MSLTNLQQLKEMQNIYVDISENPILIDYDSTIIEKEIKLAFEKQFISERLEWIRKYRN